MIDRGPRPVRTLPAGIAAVLVLVASVAVLGTRVRASPESALEAFVAAWQDGDFAAMQRHANGAADLAQTYRDVHDRLGVEGVQVTTMELRQVGNQAAARFTATLELAGVGSWRYDGSIALRRTGRLPPQWYVAWTPSTLHPALEAGHRLEAELLWSARAPILDVADRPLTIDTTVVSMGIEPRRTDDLDATLQAARRHVEFDVGRARAAVAAAQPHWFVAVADLREERYTQLRPALAPIAGVVFQRRPTRMAPAEGFAAHLLGSTGEVTAELLDELGSPYSEGDTVGRSGLELAFERALAGGPSAEIRLVDAQDRVVRTLDRVEGARPSPLRTTLDLHVQTAAEAALAGVDAPAALVAIHVPTGGVRASVSRPLGEGFNRAFSGRYPPGSTFKVVTAAAALGAGWSPDTTVPCPAQLTFGRPFRNAGGAALGDISLREAFVQSCNTAFVHLASRVGGEPLATAARAFGFGADYSMPVAVGGGSFPDPGDDADLGAAAIGQGRVLATPLHMAAVVAAASGGAWRAPWLIRDAGGEQPDPRTIDAAHTGALREWMHDVVARGTGTAAAVPGVAVAGKTGTAEVAPTAPTHAWFIGFHADLAFAVLVEGGGFGGTAAAPIAARFVEALQP